MISPLIQCDLEMSLELVKGCDLMEDSGRADDVLDWSRVAIENDGDVFVTRLHLKEKTTCGGVCLQKCCKGRCFGQLV